MLRPELQALIHEPSSSDDKYSRGVVGFITGSSEYPGAVILGVTAAMRTGIGMVRYLGPESVGHLLLEVRPEAVLQHGRAQAWVLGSGVPVTADPIRRQELQEAFEAAELAVVDAGALSILNFATPKLNAVLTPHAGEAVALFARYSIDKSIELIKADPALAARELTELTGCSILLKGNTTVLSVEDATREIIDLDSNLATAGTGDVLAGIIGALMAANHDEIISGKAKLIDLLELAVHIHSEAASIAALDGPVVALDVAEAVREAMRELQS